MFVIGRDGFKPVVDDGREFIPGHVYVYGISKKKVLVTAVEGDRIYFVNLYDAMNRDRDARVRFERRIIFVHGVNDAEGRLLEQIEQLEAMADEPTRSHAAFMRQIIGGRPVSEIPLWRHCYMCGYDWPVEGDQPPIDEIVCPDCGHDGDLAEEVDPTPFVGRTQ